MVKKKKTWLDVFMFRQLKFLWLVSGEKSHGYGVPLNDSNFTWFGPNSRLLTKSPALKSGALWPTMWSASFFQRNGQVFTAFLKYMGYAQI